VLVQPPLNGHISYLGTFHAVRTRQSDRGASSLLGRGLYYTVCRIRGLVMLIIRLRILSEVEQRTLDQDCVWALDVFVSRLLAQSFLVQSPRPSSSTGEACFHIPPAGRLDDRLMSILDRI
jgi:hypothetical protein